MSKTSKSDASSYEAVSYEADTDTAHELLTVLKDCGMEDAYSQYDSISGSHVIYVCHTDYARANDIAVTFHNDLEDAGEENGEDAVAEEQPVLLYSNSDEKYKDNLSSAYTFLIIGVAGLIALVLYDFGLIPVFNTASKILFNVVAAALFTGFIIAGIMSLRYSRKLKLAIDVDSAMLGKAVSYLEANLSKEAIESSYDSSDIPDEMKYYRRTDAIKQCISSEFDDVSEELMNEICDRYYNSLFGQN